MGNPFPVLSRWQCVQQQHVEITALPLTLHEIYFDAGLISYCRFVPLFKTDNLFFICANVLKACGKSITIKLRKHQFFIQRSCSIMLPFRQPLALKMPVLRSGTAYTVRGRRPVTQSCSLLSVAHTLTHQGWNTCHDQHAASGSQNKLLTCAITALTQVILPQWAWVGWGTMSSKVKQHAGKPKSPGCSCEEFHRIPETLMRKNPMSVPIFVEPNWGDGPSLAGCGRDERDSLFSSNFSAAFSGHSKTCKSIFSQPCHDIRDRMQDFWSSRMKKMSNSSQSCNSALRFHPSLSNCSSVKH